MKTAAAAAAAAAAIAIAAATALATGRSVDVAAACAAVAAIAAADAATAAAAGCHCRCCRCPAAAADADAAATARNLHKHCQLWIQARQPDTRSPAIPLSARPQHPLPPAWLPLASPCVHGFRLLALGTHNFSDTLPRLPRLPAVCGPVASGPNCRYHPES